MDVNRPFFHPCFGHIRPLPAKTPVRTTPQKPNRPMNDRFSAGPVIAWLAPEPSRLLTLIILTVALSGCSTAQIDSIPQEIGGLPANTPSRSAQPPSYPAVHDMPPPRAPVLDAEQQKKLEADLVALRNRQPNQQKNIAREKAKAEKAAKAKAAQEKGGKSGKGKKKLRTQSEQAVAPPGLSNAPTGPAAASGTPPWPLPPQTTGGSARP